MLRTRLRSGAGLFEELRGSWQELVGSAPGATPFQTYEWQSTWWRRFGGLREPRFFILEEGNDLVGLMPLVRARGAWRTLRPMGIGPSDYLQPLAREGYEQVMAQELRQALADMEDVDLIDLHQIRETQPLAVAAEPIAQATCLLLDLPATYDAYLATLGKSLRYDVRKLDKTMFTSGRATIETFGPDDTDRGLDFLFELHKMRWKKRHLPGAFLGKSVAFHREWAGHAARQGWLWLSILRVDGEPIGAIYAMALGDTAYYYQAGFDPEKGSVSPGTLLVAATIRRAIEEGKAHFDFMRGDEPYKRRWKPQHELRNLRLIMPGKSARGRSGASWNLFGSRVEGRIRARLEGKGLL